MIKQRQIYFSLSIGGVLAALIGVAWWVPQRIRSKQNGATVDDTISNNHNPLTGTPRENDNVSTYTQNPLTEPTFSPTFLRPQLAPHLQPSLFPTSPPSVHSLKPTVISSTMPSDIPSLVPSAIPSARPTNTPSSRPSLKPSSLYFSSTTTFYAIGDVPYNSSEAEELIVQMKTIPPDAEFVIHIGDIRSEKESVTCRLQDYQTVSSILRLSFAPVFMIPGDNEWNECPNSNQGQMYWREEILGFESKYWNHTFNITRHPTRPENFSFNHKGTLFIGLNLVGGTYAPKEWSVRLTDEVQWTMSLIRQYAAYETGLLEVGRVVIFGHGDPTSHHAAFFAPFTKFIKNELRNTLPILYLNGDGHHWAYESNFFGQPSFLRIMVVGGSSEPPLKVMINASGTNTSPSDAFEYDRMLR